MKIKALVLVVLGLLIFQSCATLDLTTANDYDITKEALSKEGIIDATASKNKMETIVELQNKLMKKFHSLKEGDVLIVFPELKIGSEVNPGSYVAMGFAATTGTGSFQVQKRPTIEITYMKAERQLVKRFLETPLGSQQIDRDGVLVLYYGEDAQQIGLLTMTWLCYIF